MERKTLESEASHENSKHTQADHEIPVLYYLSRNGQLEHPHLMYVSVSSPHGTLRLKDVMNTLSFLRGPGIANMYSWSTKRNYRNGFVWQDLSENDFISPSSNHEYVLKGTQLIEPSSHSSNETILSMPSSKSSNDRNSYNIDAADSLSSTMKDSQCDCKLYKANICREFAENSCNAWTQTDDMINRNRMEMDLQGERRYPGNVAARKFDENRGSLSFEGCSLESEDIRNQKTENERPSGRMRATQVLMQLVSCRSSIEEL
ncbi:unnamed protein product [Vicia faba]|uniref:SOSEKI DIX-like domain-containing protein n=1 Tax=Vicia faba TaxID=3906 RepID=A0AAV0ZX49_VICFA|nr:unnamed protein product [Vicia faba]